MTKAARKRHLGKNRAEEAARSARALVIRDTAQGNEVHIYLGDSRGLPMEVGLVAVVNHPGTEREQMVNLVIHLHPLNSSFVPYYQQGGQFDER